MKPKLSSGLRYGYDGAGKRVCLGAQMGRPNILPSRGCPKLHLVRLPFVDGDYDQGGAYWGSPANLYFACSAVKVPWVSAWTGQEMTEPHRVEVYVRAANREQAKQKVRELIPGAKFFR